MSEKAIFSLIPKIMSEIGAIAKGRSNTHQNYAFRGIEDMYNTIHPALVSHGVFCAPEVLESSTETIEKREGQAVKFSYRVLLRVRHRFYAPDGSCVDVVTQGEGIDSSDKASNKAMSAAMKYAFIELFSIPTEDVSDSDRESPEAGQPLGHSQPQAKALAQQNTRPGAYKIPFGKKYNGVALEQIPEQDLRSYLNYLDDSIRKSGKNPDAKVLELFAAAEKFFSQKTPPAQEPDVPMNFDDPSSYK